MLPIVISSIVISSLALIVSLIAPFYSFFKPAKILFINPSQIILQYTESNKLVLTITCTFFNKGAPLNPEVVGNIEANLNHANSRNAVVAFKWNAFVELISKGGVAQGRDGTSIPVSPIPILGQALVVKTIFFDNTAQKSILSEGHYELVLKGYSAITLSELFNKKIRFALDAEHISKLTNHTGIFVDIR